MFIKENNLDKFLKASDEQVEKALLTIGLQAENYARNNAPVDTGLLRNSITSAVGGKETSVKMYKADKGNETGQYGGAIQEKEYPYVLVGTNVEYAPYVEMNNKKKPQGYLRPALADHAEEYKAIVKNELENLSLIHI